MVIQKTLRASRPLVSLFILSLICIPVSSQAQVVSEHKDRATPMLLYSPEYRAKAHLSAEQQANAFLSENYSRFKLPQDLSNLKLKRMKESLLGRHFHFQQYINNIPVEKAEIIVSVDTRDSKIYMVFNNTYPQKRPIALLGTISSDDALDIAWNHLRVHGALISRPTTEIVYAPEKDEFRLIYITNVNVLAPSGYWEVRIDAVTGEVIAVRETSIDRIKRERGVNLDFDRYKGPIFSREETTARFLERQAEKERIESALAAITVNGTADVFDPDPRTTLQDDTIEDTDPPATFANAYLNRILRDIKKDGNTYRLDGPWVRIIDFEPPNTVPSTTTNGSWTARRGNNAFNDVMTYFHIDQNQRYIQSLGFTNIVQRRIDADSDGLQLCNDGPNLYDFCFVDDCPGGSCVGGGICDAGPNVGQPCVQDDCPAGSCESAYNAYYDSNTDHIALGHGCVDANEDADVILHEYGHAIMHDINSNWDKYDADMGGIGEGFGDFWGGSYSYSTPNGPAFHPEWVGSWWSHNLCWEGRFMDRLTFEYDPHETYPDHKIVHGVLSDELWGTPLFQSFLELIKLGRARTEMDRIILQSQFGLGAGVTMPVMANATVSAAQSLYPSGPHALVYRRHFGYHNILATYVDKNWTGSENGTIDNPYNTISEGVSAVLEGARLNIRAGNYASMIFQKAMTIKNYGGTVVIGSN